MKKLLYFVLIITFVQCRTSDYKLNGIWLSDKYFYNDDTSFLCNYLIDFEDDSLEIFILNYSHSLIPIVRNKIKATIYEDTMMAENDTFKLDIKRDSLVIYYSDSNKRLFTRPDVGRKHQILQGMSFEYIRTDYGLPFKNTITIYDDSTLIVSKDDGYESYKFNASIIHDIVIYSSPYFTNPIIPIESRLNGKEIISKNAKLTRLENKLNQDSFKGIWSLNFQNQEQMNRNPLIPPTPLDWKGIDIQFSDDSASVNFKNEQDSIINSYTLKTMIFPNDKILLLNSKNKVISSWTINHENNLVGKYKYFPMTLIKNGG
ncbi:MAG: hypothetical protein JXQ87_17905 [Bacteroidia bacterium]